MVECDFRIMTSEKDVVTKVPRTYCNLKNLYDCAEENCILQQQLKLLKEIKKMLEER